MNNQPPTERTLQFDPADIKTKLLDLPIGKNENSIPAGYLENYAKRLAATGAKAMDEVNKDTAEIRDPQDRINRIAMVDLTTDPEIVEQGYYIRKHIDGVSKRAQFEIGRVLGALNNYDTYVNVQGVKEQKAKLLDHYGNGKADRETRYAVSAAEVLDIFEKQRKEEGLMTDVSVLEKTIEGIVTDAMSGLLQSTGSEDRFAEFGFSIDASTGSYEKPLSHPEAPDVHTLSSIIGEHAFIAIHQAFEVLFEEAIVNIQTLRQDVSDLSKEERSLHVKDTAVLLSSANKLYKTLRPLLTRDEFKDMRDYFGVASGAQSQQYHRLQFMIGLPNGDVTPEDRASEVELLIGKRNMNEIKEEVKETPSLRSEYNNIDPSEEEALALRELDIAFLEFKAIHGNAMLQFLPNDATGTAGSNITKFFADVMHPTFAEQFSAEELAMIVNCRSKALHKVNDNLSDEDIQFVAQNIVQAQADISEALDGLLLIAKMSQDGLAVQGATKGLEDPIKKRIKKLEVILSKHFVDQKTDTFDAMIKYVDKLKSASEQNVVRDAS